MAGTLPTGPRPVTARGRRSGARRARAAVGSGTRGRLLASGPGGPSLRKAFAPVAGLVLAATLLGVALPERDRFDGVVLDPGHGGAEEGAVAPGGPVEKELVLDVAARVAEGLRRSGVRVVLTRERDEDVALVERTRIANRAEADLFVSIHANAAESAEARGTETYFLSLEASDAFSRTVAERENEALAADVAAPPPEPLDPVEAILGDLAASGHLAESDEFARIAQAELAAIDPAPSRGVKQAPFVVLMGVDMPAALVEIGFLTHPEEAAALREDARRDEIAAALVRAVLEFGRRYDARRGVPGPQTAPEEETQS